SEHSAGPLELGRGPQRNDVPRCTIQDLYVSKDHVLLRELEDGQVRLENLSQRNAIRLGDGVLIPVGAGRNLDPPLSFTIGETTVRIDAVAETELDGPLETCATPRCRSRLDEGQSLLDLGSTPAPETLAHWFETVIAMQRAAAGSREFYDQTARAVVALVGLDRGLVVLRRNGRWMVQARFPDENLDRGREFSATILDRVARDRRTFFQSSAAGGSVTESLVGVEAVVASPIFDPRDEVVGAVYGCRSRYTAQRGLGIGPLEAQVMQLLASAVGGGLARQGQGAEAGRLRAQIQEVFSSAPGPGVQQEPPLLEGQEREVTVLCSDVRGFWRVAERLGPTDTCLLVADVMERLTEKVRAHDGVLVDYLGDGILAMWNAPADQPDHAQKACRAALA